MAQFNTKVPKFKPRKPVRADYDTFQKGLNTLLQDTEIDKRELAQADNLVMVGRGIPTKRPGLSTFYTAGNATGSVRGLKGYYPSGASSTAELVAVTDDGFLTIKNGSSFTRKDGVSWTSGNEVQMAQLDNRVYIVNGQRELARYSSPTLVGFPTISPPVILSTTNLSNATGTNVISYRMTAVSNVGETLPSGTFELAGQPQDLGGTAGGTVRLTWTGVSTASGILSGFNIYGRSTGNERFLAFANPAETTFDDDGTSIPTEFTFPPTADSTGGPKCRYMTRFQDRMIYGGFDAEPTKILISGRVPNHEKYDLANGGNFLKIEPDSGDKITALASFRDRIIVFKERSIWEVTLTTSQVGNFFITEPQLKLITGSNGCMAPKSVIPVENDLYYLARDGIRTLGYETGFSFDVLRSNELSIRVRPYFRNLTMGDIQSGVGSYFNNKYRISFPNKGETMVFDRERLGWTGPQTYGATVFERFYDTGNVEKLVLAKKDGVVVDQLSTAFTDDNGSAISTTLRTRNEDFGDWSLFKNIQSVFTQMRAVTGTVEVAIKLEERTGAVTTTKSYSITTEAGASGWGADLWADAQWGDSESTAGATDSRFTIKWANLNKIGRLMQITITTTAKNSNYELVGVRSDAKPLSRGFNPSSWRV